MAVRKLALLVLLSLSALAVSASQLYPWTDENGVVHYSDKPVRGASQQAQPQPANVVPRLNDGVLPSSAAANSKPQGFKLAIRTPSNQQTIRDNLGRVSVAGGAVPQELPQGFAFRLRMDGQVVSEPTAEPVFELMNVNRGEHKLKLELLDPLGKVIASSPVTTIYLHRTTQASGGR